MAEENDKNNTNTENKTDGHMDGSSETSELKDRLLRLAAEFDNYKKRAAKEVDNMRTIGKAELMSKMLPILDEFELAIKSMNLDNEKDKGIALVFSNMFDMMKKEGLQEVEADGRFDPYKHEIILTKESNENEGKILETVRKGYVFNGILLRPASVIVSKGSKETNENKGE